MDNPDPALATMSVRRIVLELVNVATQGAYTALQVDGRIHSAFTDARIDPFIAEISSCIPTVPDDVRAAAKRNRDLPRGAGGCDCDECVMARWITDTFPETPRG